MRNHRQQSSRFALVAALLAAASTGSPVSAGDPGSGNWPMWGGTPDRNMVSSAKGMPTEWDVKTGKNVKWSADLGSQSYGNLVVAGGMVFIGTNNEKLRDPKQPGDRGVLMAFRESDGEFLWQQTHAKLEAGRANDWPFQGVASSPLVEGDKLYYVSNRGVVFCLDIQGFRDNENDGPTTNETLTGQFDADVIWSFNMIEEVGSYPHNMSNSSPVIWGDLVFLSTSNGQDESHVNIPSPRAPAIIALNKTTGKLVWEDNSVEDRILHGQWSTPAVGRIGGVVQVVSAQGDGQVRGYEAETGKKLWEFDTNPKESQWPRTRNELIGTPVIVDGIVYIANGQDPEHGEGVGYFHAIDPTKRGEGSTSRSPAACGASRCTDRSPPPPSPTGSSTSPTSAAISTASTRRPASCTGRTTCSRPSGDRRSSSTARSTSATKTATSSILAHAKEKKVLAEINMGNPVYATVVPANGALLVNNRSRVFSLAVK